MDRVKGTMQFVIAAALVLFTLRGIHVVTPWLFPGTRPGPVAVATLDDARRRAGFSPLVPGYHPASIGAEPSSITLLFHPAPTVMIVWRQQDSYLSITQRRGGPRPDVPVLAVPLDGVPDSSYWTNGTEHHLVLQRVGYWVDLVTNLPERDVKRFADTLTVY